MTSNETKRTIAKFILVISVIMLIFVLVSQFFPDLLSSAPITGASSSKDLKTAYDQIQSKYKTISEEISVHNKNVEDLNASISQLNGYAGNKYSKYAIGTGISLIIGLWISTVILYMIEKKNLFNK